jgi:hypothetical protein
MSRLESTLLTINCAAEQQRLAAGMLQGSTAYWGCAVARQLALELRIFRF